MLSTNRTLIHSTSRPTFWNINFVNLITIHGATIADFALTTDCQISFLMLE